MELRPLLVAIPPRPATERAFAEKKEKIIMKMKVSLALLLLLPLLTQALPTRDSIAGEREQEVRSFD